VHTSLVIMVSGPDRPGIVERVASTVAAFEGSWDESRMARLAGRFAGVVSISVPATKVASLRRALDDLPQDGLTIVVEEASVEDPRPDDDQSMVLELTGSDREGIVKEVSTVLANHRVNVEEIVTRRRPAPMAGGMLFEIQAQLRCPVGTDVHDLREALEALSSELAVDIMLGTLGAAND
jgi:glycine cleavage system regulatory protein